VAGRRRIAANRSTTSDGISAASGGGPSRPSRRNCRLARRRTVNAWFSATRRTQPLWRIVGADSRPAGRRPGEGFLHHILGFVEVTEHNEELADQAAVAAA
jgi:hypothetical protein